MLLQFADVSQQLCDRLKQLLLTCASCKLLSLVDSDPLGYKGPFILSNLYLVTPPVLGPTPTPRLSRVSHFAIGQSDIRGLRLTTFVYCKPAPFLAQANAGLYKCMRWNVDLPGNQPAANEVWDGESEELDVDKLCFTQ